MMAQSVHINGFFVLEKSSGTGCEGGSHGLQCFLVRPMISHTSLSVTWGNSS
jgi:hypothetical protein